MIPKRQYTKDFEGIEKVEEHPLATVGMKPDVELCVDGESYRLNFMYQLSTTKDGEYAVFLTNRSVEPEDVRGLCNRYSRR